MEDVKALMRARKLPEHYATRFIAAARGNRWWSNSIGCGQPPLACCQLPAATSFLDKHARRRRRHPYLHCRLV